MDQKHSCRYMGMLSIFQRLTELASKFNLRLSCFVTWINAVPNRLNLSCPHIFMFGFIVFVANFSFMKEFLNKSTNKNQKPTGLNDFERQ